MSTTTGGSSAAPAGGDSPFPHLAGELVPWPLIKAILTKGLAGDDPFPWPWLRNFGPTRRDGGAYPTAQPGYSETPGRAKYSALRLGAAVAITATGQLSNFNEIADIRQMPWRIYPPQFGFFIYSPHITLPAMRDFAFTEIFGFPADVKSLIIHDSDGPHTVEISEPKNAAISALMAAPITAATAAPTATGTGHSLQEAFDNAVAQLPANVRNPDGIIVYTLVEAGRMRGGFAGFDHHYAKVQAKM